jgi:hypothetical protein
MGLKGMMMHDIFRQYAESFHLRINTDSYLLPARYPSHIMGKGVPLGCDVDFEFLVGIHNNTPRTPIHFS